MIKSKETMDHTTPLFYHFFRTFSACDFLEYMIDLYARAYRSTPSSIQSYQSSLIFIFRVQKRCISNHNCTTPPHTHGLIIVLLPFSLVSIFNFYFLQFIGIYDIFLIRKVSFFGHNTTNILLTLTFENCIW
jgi:hypothetical protein